MPIKYVPFFPDTVEGQAILNNFVRTRRALNYKDNDGVYRTLQRGMPYFELEKVESVGNNPKNILIRGECISACAFLQEKGIKVDLIYIDPPYASGADYTKNVYIRRNPKIADAIKKAEEQMEIEDLKAFEEKMYGDIWKKEAYLNWMYENLVAIKNVLNENASVYIHLDWHIVHYVKILADEIFGEDNFQREIIWRLGWVSGYKSIAKNWIRNHETILYYSKNNDLKIFNKDYVPYPPDYERWGGRPSGQGLPIEDVWGVFPQEGVTSLQVVSFSKEDTSYDTQKPEGLLERIIKASTHDGMMIADFFGGSGVTAKVANDLKRNFIHVDVGINSIQTTRDRLVAANAEFDIYEIKDGVNLFRNPTQTMDKLSKLIPGLQRNTKGLSKYWFGKLNDSKLGMIPVYVPDLRDHTQRVFDKPIANQLVNQELGELENVKKVVVYYIDLADKKEIEQFIKEQNNTEIEVELRDLKQVLSETVIDDIIEYKAKQEKAGYCIEIKKIISDRLLQKIDEYNQKGLAQPTKQNDEQEEENGNGNGNGNGENGEAEKKKKKFSPIKISKGGLELIELVSLDCTNRDSIWKSDKEIKIDKLGYVIEDGQKTKNFWDAKIRCEKKPLRMKVRNIAGDEIIIEKVKLQ